MSYSIYKEVGGGFEDVLVIPAVNEVLKAVVAKYTASDLVGNRSAVSAELDAQLDEKLNSRGIFVEDFNIIDWDFSTEYIAAVEAKQVAEQNLIKTRTEQEQQTVIAEAEAERQVITANAAAQSALIAAEAEAKRIVMEAEAQAEANQKLAASLNESVIEYLKIQRWNGVLPYVTGEASPFVDISSMVE
jgi:regulator of protease activity HflC (stomatin/prohibitin superfamily)